MLKSSGIKYLLETKSIIDKNSPFWWETELISPEPRKNKNTLYEKPSTLTLKIKNVNNKFNALKRIVLFEKRNEKSTKNSYELGDFYEIGFFPKWSLISKLRDKDDITLFGLKDTIDFKLIKIDYDGNVLSSWFLNQCSLEYDSKFNTENEEVITLIMQSFSLKLL